MEKRENTIAYDRRAEELFELYQNCANRKQVETICLNFLRSLDATTVNKRRSLVLDPVAF